MTFTARLLAPVALAVVLLPLRVSAQVSREASLAYSAKSSSAVETASFGARASTASMPVELPLAWAGERTARLDSMMAQWDAAYRVTTRRACFRGDREPANQVVNMVGLVMQSQSVPAEDREAVTSAIYRAWYDVVNHGGCAGLIAPPFQVITGLGDAQWLTPMAAPAADARVERDASGRMVAVTAPAVDYGHDATRRWIYDGASGSEQLIGAEDVVKSNKRRCVVDMAEVAGTIGGRYPALVTRRNYSVPARSGSAFMADAACLAFAASPLSVWTIDFLNPRTNLVEAAVQLRRTEAGEFEVVAHYPGAGYQ